MKNIYGTKLRETLPNRRQIHPESEIWKAMFFNIWTDRQINAVTHCKNETMKKLLDLLLFFIFYNS